jgi:hypothetical protein
MAVRELVFAESNGEIELPHEDWYRNDVAVVTRRFLELYEQLLTQEERGSVSEPLILNVILAGWELKKHGYQKDENVRTILSVQLPAIAKKYGFSTLYRAGLLWTLKRRLEKKVAEHGGLGIVAMRLHCARCGKAIWNPDSVKRGLGPICKDKVGTPVQRS